MLPPSFIHTPGRILTNEHEFVQPKSWEGMAPRIGAEKFPVWADVNDEKGKMEKCRMKPACVEVCPFSALQFGSINEIQEQKEAKISNRFIKAAHLPMP